MVDIALAPPEDFNPLVRRQRPSAEESFVWHGLIPPKKARVQRVEDRDEGVDQAEPAAAIKIQKKSARQRPAAEESADRDKAVE